MKRSRINALLRDAEAFIHKQGFFLPPFARWTPADWRGKGEEVREIVDHGLGWDITDFGQGDYAKCGLLLFTIRNGDAADLARGTGRLYAEKLLIVEPGQVTPLHFHWKKTEDIINRGGGKLMLRLHNVAADETLADSEVTVSLDGVRRTVKAGSTVTLSPGESITLNPCHYHSFWAEEQRVMAGEVSMVNDDHADNRFFEKVGRFPVIEEDEKPVYLLATDYPDYYRP
jgi:D-lyxose ketol-isomerase